MPWSVGLFDMVWVLFIPVQEQQNCVSFISNYLSFAGIVKLQLNGFSAQVEEVVLVRDYKGRCPVRTIKLPVLSGQDSEISTLWTDSCWNSWLNMV